MQGELLSASAFTSQPKRHPEMETDQLLAGFSTLFFHERFRAEFTGEAVCDYETRHHLIRAHPVKLEVTSK